MGVDISLHIEVRVRDKWHLLTFQSPFWEQNHEYPIFDTEIYNCRYYHFQDFLEEASTHTRDHKEILSEELQAKLSDNDDNMGFGTFMFDDLERYCDKQEKLFISRIFHTEIHSIKEQLNRIEQMLYKGSTITPQPEKREDTCEENAPIEQMYEDFMWDYGCVFGLRDTVRALTSLGYSSFSSANIRIFYLIC